MSMENVTVIHTNRLVLLDKVKGFERYTFSEGTPGYDGRYFFPMIVFEVNEENEVLPIVEKITEFIISLQEMSQSNNTLESTLIKGKYVNPWNETIDTGSTSTILKYAFLNKKQNIPEQSILDLILPIENPIFCQHNAGDIFATWIGHSTLVVEMNDVTLITDPMFSDSPLTSKFIGIKRYRKPACNVDDLPSSLSMVLISHNHWDHLDERSVFDLNKRYGHRLTWLVPKGLAEWFERRAVRNVEEFDWWEQKTIYTSIRRSVNVVFCPAQHWSQTTLSDKNTSLWGSWCVLGLKKFFFAGDTGFREELFKKIGEDYGPFNLAAIPIGASEPREMMQYNHVNVVEAIAIHKLVGSLFSIGIHWGTFTLSSEHFLKPSYELSKVMSNDKFDRLCPFVTVTCGRTICVI